MKHDLYNYFTRKKFIGPGTSNTVSINGESSIFLDVQFRNAIRNSVDLVSKEPFPYNPF